MADDNEKISFSLDLDAKEASDTLSSLVDKIGSIGDARSLDGLISGLEKVSFVAGTIGVAFLAIGASVEAVFNAENIKQVNNQFDAMTKHLGIIGDELKENLLTATRGFATETDTLKAANIAMVQLGEGAAKSSEIMEIARKSTAVYGGEVIDRFEQITQAIASGREKQLKSIGIYVDAKKALEDYAKSVNATVGQLNEAGKRQALLNAVLVTGKDAFKNVDESVKQTTNSWDQLKVTFKEIGETISLIIDKTIGPALRAAIGLFKELATGINEFTKATLGDGPAKAAAETRILTQEQIGLKTALDDLDKSGRVFYQGQWVERGSVMADNMSARLDQLNAKIKQNTETAIAEHQKQVAAVSGGAVGGPESTVDKEKQAADEAKFQAEITKIKEDALKSQMKLADNAAVFDTARLTERELEEQKHQDKIKEIQLSQTLTEKQKNELIEVEAEAHQSRMQTFDLETLQKKEAIIEKEKQMSFDLSQYDELVKEQKLVSEQEFQAKIAMIKNMQFDSEAQRQAAIENEERAHQERIVQIDMESTSQRERVIDQWANHADSAMERFVRGVGSGSMKAANQMNNFAKMGQKAFDAFGKHATNAFVQLGEGSKKGTDIMREAFFGMLSDIAIQQGEVMLLAGLFPPNPAVMAAGAGLLVLGGMLKSMGSGKTSAMGVGGGDYGSGGFSSGSQAQSVSDQQQERKSVSVNVMGNYFETEQTKSRLLDLIRQSTDATDFKYVQIGQT